MVRALENYLPSSVRAERSSNDVVTLIENQGSSDTSAEAHSIGFHALWYGDLQNIGCIHKI